MTNSIKLLILLIGFALILGIGIVSAQDETATTDVTQELNLDENIQAEDLEVSEPNILPDNPIYFLKEWGRNIQSVFTFNPIAKAKLKEKFANEKLIEVKKMVEQNKAGKVIEKGIENYQNEVEEAKRVIERIKETAEENTEVGKFLDKFIQQQTLHQRILQKLEGQVSTTTFAKIEEARERHLEKFGAVMNKLQENKEQLKERLEKNLEELKGSQFKNFKNLEVLKNLEEKVPEEAKEAIQKAQENALKRLKGDLEQMSSEDQEKFKEYIEKISGEKERHMEIMENLREGLKELPIFKENFLQTRERILEKIQERVEGLKTACPTVEKPAAGFCEKGRILIKKDEEGCIVEFKCVIPAEIEVPEKPTTPGEGACITLWDPVCGKTGKTYSNTCFAKLAGVEVVYKGECKEKVCQTDADCPQPKCGPIGTITARCIGIQTKCVEGECKIISVTPLAP